MQTIGKLTKSFKLTYLYALLADDKIFKSLSFKYILTAFGVHIEMGRVKNQMF
jgi:hypothetical protein